MKHYSLKREKDVRTKHTGMPRVRFEYSTLNDDSIGASSKIRIVSQKELPVL